MKKKFKTFINSDAETRDREVRPWWIPRSCHCFQTPIVWTPHTKKGTQAVWKKFHESADLEGLELW